MPAGVLAIRNSWTAANLAAELNACQQGCWRSGIHGPPPTWRQN